jgi:ribosomal 50S subunit-associated protein YjgA (DUF615 family)
MSNKLNDNLIEAAEERAREIGIHFYIQKVDKLIKDNDLEALRELLSHMGRINANYDN